MKTWQGDKWVLGLAAALVAIGLAMLYSVSTVESLDRYGNTSYYVRHQLLNGGLVGLLGLVFFYRLPLKLLKKFAFPFVVLALLLLALVKVPGVGFSAGGASSWISVGPIFFQPSEIMKLAAVIYASAWLAAKDSFRSFGESVGPMFAVVGLGALLILWQPDFGTMVTLLGTVFLLSFSSGVPLKWIVGIGVAGLVGLLLLVKIEPYRIERLLTFLNPSTDPQGAGYQVLQGLLAIGSGGLWGLGYGLSRQKYNYLPEVLGDSFFAVVAEELGFVRALLILAIFLLLFLRGLRIAGQAPDKFSKNLALGVVALFSVQFFVNMGAVLGLLPLTGVPLPFFSYGSSALIVNLCALGILLNVSRDVKLK